MSSKKAQKRKRAAEARSRTAERQRHKSDEVHHLDGGGEPSFLTRSTSMLWTARSGGQKVGILAVGVSVLALIAAIALWPSPREVTPDEREAAEVRAMIDPIAELSERPLAEMEEFLAGPDPATLSEASDAAYRADRWGYAFSVAKQSYITVAVPVERLPRRSGFQVGNGVFSAALWAEAAENIYLLPYLDPEVWPAVMNQARRLVAIGKASLATQYLAIAEEYNLDPSAYSPRTEYPMVPDADLVSEQLLPPISSDGGKIQMTRYADIPASAIPRAEPAVDFLSWAEKTATTAEQTNLSAINSELCGQGLQLANQQVPIPQADFKQHITHITNTGNVFGNEVLPDTMRSLYGNVYQSLRTLAEGAGAYSLLAGDYTKVPEAVYRLRIKGLRLTNMGGVQWQNALSIARNKGLDFFPLPACDASLFAVYHTPWDARQELTKLIDPS